MKKSIGFDYKYDSPPLERIRLIEEAGFDGIYLHSQYKPAEYIGLLRKASSLEIESLHLPYKKLHEGKTVDSRYVNVLWKDEDESRPYVADLIREIEFASRHGIGIVVMHLTGGEDPPPLNDNGIRSIEKILNVCEQHGIALCLENLRRLDYVDHVFARLTSDKLLFCFDSGHANCMTKNVESFPWEQYRHKLHYLHLNDNNGMADQHLIPFNGNIRWDRLLKEVFSYNNRLSLTLEVRSSSETRKQLTEKQYLQLCFESVVKLQGLLEA